MKTAISIPDQLFESAEKFAKEQGLSRSELYAAAVRDYLRERQREWIAEKLDEVYGAESSDLDSTVSHAQTRSLSEDAW